MSHCPRCESSELAPTLIEDALPALGCGSCSGLLLSLVAYRLWRERGPSSLDEFLSDEVEVAEDGHEVLQCPKCRRLMTKYRITTDVGNRLDYCDHCGELWLDAGEWEYIVHVLGADRLAAVVTQPWQRRVRAERTAEMKEQRLRELLGADYARFAAFSAWLETHPQRETILAQLVAGSDA